MHARPDRSQLEKLRNEVSTGLDRVSNRERTYNSKFEGEIEQFRAAKDALAEAEASYTMVRTHVPVPCCTPDTAQQASGTITALASELQQVTEELEEIKARMDERGASMTDASPVMKIRQSLAKLKSENVAMDLRLGVLQQSLMHARLREKVQRVHAHLYIMLCLTCPRPATGSCGPPRGQSQVDCPAISVRLYM